MELLQKLNTTAQPRDRPFGKDNDNKTDSTEEEEKHLKKERILYLQLQMSKQDKKLFEKKIALNYFQSSILFR